MNVRAPLLALLAVNLTSGVALPQMPKEDVVEVPAIAQGLCVSNLFQTHMVLQRDKPLNIWGWARSGERVSVSFAGTEHASTAGPDRAWSGSPPALPASSQPRTMTISGESETIELEDILVGDVWVLGGQSNMEFELAKVENGALEIASANYPQIRVLTVPYGEGPQIRRGFERLHEWSGWFGRHFRKGDWDPCTPEIARNLSAIGFVFARRIHMAEQVPVGVIDASRGGTTVESWTPHEKLRAMTADPVQAKLADWDRRVEEWDPAADLQRRVQQNRDWVTRAEAEGRNIPEDRLQDPSDLRPGPIADHNYPGSCFGGMIGPLSGLSVKGVIFHQGYNNALDGMPGVRLYREVFPEMIHSWREAFGDPELPFGILSLCTDGYPQTRQDYLEKMLNAGIHIRAVQYECFLELLNAGDEHVGFASTYDLRRRWYHPQVKLPAGERIARWALSTEYGHGRALPWKPPMLLDTRVEEGRLVLTFDTDVGDPMDGRIEGFAIAGEDRRFQPATAEHLEVGKDDRGRSRFDRKQIVLSSPWVPSPTEFRYAWGRNPLANLQATGNKDLPVATQKSDSWDMGTVPLGVLEEPIEGKLTRGQRNAILQVLRDADRQRAVREARAILAEESEKEGKDG